MEGPAQITPLEAIDIALKAYSNDAPYTFPTKVVLTQMGLDSPEPDGRTLLDRILPENVEIENPAQAWGVLRKVIRLQRNISQIPELPYTTNRKSILAGIAPILTTHILREGGACTAAMSYTQKIVEVDPGLVPEEVLVLLQGVEEDEMLPDEMTFPIQEITEVIEIGRDRNKSHLRSALVGCLFTVVGSVLRQISDKPITDILSMTTSIGGGILLSYSINRYMEIRKKIQELIQLRDFLDGSGTEEL